MLELGANVSPEKIEAYLRTDYRVERGDAPFALRIGEVSRELLVLYAELDVDCGVFITAFNPSGRVQSSEANEVALVQLGAELRTACTHVLQGVGVDLSGEWPGERSYLALGITLEGAKLFGRRYGQDAVVWVGADAVPALVVCDDI